VGLDPACDSFGREAERRSRPAAGADSAEFPSVLAHEVKGKLQTLCDFRRGEELRYFHQLSSLATRNDGEALAPAMPFQ
jgi:hypothetical protein